MAQLMAQLLTPIRSDKAGSSPQQARSQINVKCRQLIGMKLPRPKLRAIFALRTTTAALFAFALAWSFSIHHPWWAAMTVWLVAQPTRGLLFERSLARLIGTICGALAGALILATLAEDRLGALTAVAAWLALCAGLGNIFRHFRNYGFVLAGYTASIVVLFGFNQGVVDSGLALDRVICTVMGIVSSAVFSFRALPKADRKLMQRKNAVLQRCLSRLEQFFHGGSMSEPVDALTSGIAALNRSTDEYAAGSFRRQLESRRIRRVSGLLLELIALTNTPRSQRLAAYSNNLTSPETGNRIEPRLESLIATANEANEPAIASTLDELRQLLISKRQSPLPLGLDIQPASIWRAAARPVIALTITATIWWGSNWASGAMMVMTAALFTSLFSSHDQGNHMLIQVLLGTLAGAVTGVLARLFLLPHANDLTTTLLCIAPFLLVGAWLMQRPATSKMAIDLIMTFLLTAQPSSPPAGVAVALNEAAALIAGVIIAVATFWAVLPATPAVHGHLLAQRIARLTLQFAKRPGDTTAKAILPGLRSGLTRLLGFTKPQSAIFMAAQECLATVSRAAANNNQPTPSASSLNTPAYVHAARQAAATLCATLKKTPKGDTA